MISQIFILSSRGDTVISKDFLGLGSKGISDVFFRRYKSQSLLGKNATPIFEIEGSSFLYIEECGLLLVAVSRENISPSLVLELLKRIACIIKDYCGTLSEESVRKNVILLYELLDEIVDCGYPQNSSSESLKEYVFMDPTILKPKQNNIIFTGAAKGPTKITQSILNTGKTDRGRRDEIFVDIVEKISCTFSANGYVQNSQIDGSIQIKSYLSRSMPVAIALNDSLVIGDQGAVHTSRQLSKNSSIVMLDDCNFHESVDLSQFETERTLRFTPPDGEIAVMNYRSTYPFEPPFTVTVSTKEDCISTGKVVIYLKIQALFSKEKSASGVEIICPMPNEIQWVNCNLENGKAGKCHFWDWQEKHHKLVWKFKRLNGGESHTLEMKATLIDNFAGQFKLMGPISLHFTIPAYNASNLGVRYLQILKTDANYNPYRWVRYATMSNSYIIRPR